VFAETDAIGRENGGQLSFDLCHGLIPWSISLVISMPKTEGWRCKQMSHRRTKSVFSCGKS
jgi:hypothetical protein